MNTTIAQIRDLLRPGLFEVTGKYDMIPAQWKSVFDTSKSEMTVERSVEMRYLSLAAVKTEGGNIYYDTGAGQRFVYNQEHVELAIGYIFTKKAIDDNLYKTQFGPSAMGMNESFAQTKEILAADVFNSGNVYNPQIGGDGQPLFSTSHPIDGGTFANRPTTDMQLNESTLQSALTQIRNFRNAAGMKILARGRKLIVPPSYLYVAERLTKTELRPGTADNDVNAIRTTGGLPEGYVVMDFLTSNFAWFIKTDKPGFKYMQRIAYETDMIVDFNTGNLLTKGYERYSFSYNQPRCGWGTYPTA
jgi:hypothetical protein